MDIVRTFHGEMRWLVTIVAVIAIIKFALGLIRKEKYGRLDRGLMSGLVGLVDFNFLLGLILLFPLGFDNRTRLEHIGTMLIVVLLGHSNAIWKKSGNSGKLFRNNLILVVVMLALVFVAVQTIRGGFF